MKQFRSIGLMSGTSLDGLDVALCNFKRYNNSWSFEIEKTSAIKYDNHWKNTLAKAKQLNAYEFVNLHKRYGNWIGAQVAHFISANQLNNIDLIASHGHTIFHEPDKQINFQIGDGAMIASKTGITTVSDFRTLDIAMGGQGAPLVPIGDKFLFHHYDCCLNLGGFSNISFEKSGKRLAFDISPTNIIANKLSKFLGKNYDEGGAEGSKGQIHQELLQQLNSISYYKKQPPKSLGIEWLDQKFIPILDSVNMDVKSKLRTYYEHIAMQITDVIKKNYSQSKILVTGGGAYNKFLIHRINRLLGYNVIIPDSNLIEFKEALIFAFLGVLRILRNNNCLATVTGSKENNSSGIVHWIK